VHTAVRCRACGFTNPLINRYCGQCGRPLPSPAPPAPLGPSYTPLRLQIDPLSPPPRRDVRWVLIVLGIAFVIVGVLFFVVGALVSSVLAGGAGGCGPGSCPGVDPGPWFIGIGLPFLVLGVALLSLGLWWALR
jgi:hypothetical protein